jgi:2-oxoisovalerate dehydrogenase E1 component
MIQTIPGFASDAQGKPVIGLDPASLYAYGQLIRSAEQLILSLFDRGLLSGTTHTCIGQELCQMAVVRALNDPGDAVLSNHRNHGHFLAYSGHFLGLVAEVMGRADGVCGGYGGSQHIAFRHFHSNGVQAGMTGIGVGLALARQRKNSGGGLVAIMIGDGTLGEGLLYESLNLASIWNAPVLFVVENNRIAQTTLTEHTLGGSIAGRGQAFGLDTFELDDAAPDFTAQVDRVVAEQRAKQRPALLVIETRRLGPHSKGDDLRDDEEKRGIRERDPLSALARRLTPEEREAIDARNAEFLRHVEAAALASPEARFQQQPDHAFRPARAMVAPAQPVHAPNVRAALNQALRDLLANQEDTILLGEDLHEPYGGAFKVTAGLSSAFPGRVISTPISEAGITGAGIGLALAGRRPIVEIMFADFLSLCLDQIYNHAVKFPGMFPDVDVPLLIRTPCGGRRGYGPTHSQSPENLFVSVPGLTVAYPSHRHNCGQMLADAATRWPNPTLFLEHKLLYAETQDPADYTELPADAADIGSGLFPTLRRGAADPDVTLIAFGGMLPVAERAAHRLEQEEELAVEIVAPALLAPLPRQALLGLLLDRPCIAVVEESHHEYGVGAEILACLAEAGYQGRIGRIGTSPVPIAAARSLEREQLPDEDTIIANVLDLFSSEE